MLIYRRTFIIIIIIIIIIYKAHNVNTQAESEAPALAVVRWG